MQLARTILHCVFGSTERSADPEPERFSRFAPDTAAPVRDRDNTVVTFALRKTSTEPEEHHAPQPRPPVDDWQQPMRCTRFGTAHPSVAERRKSQTQAFERPELPSPDQLSNEGAQHIPLSVLKRALPDRFRTMPPTTDGTPYRNGTAWAMAGEAE